MGRFYDMFYKFQSTRPVRGATTTSTRASPTGSGFNPRAPYGARQVSGSVDMPFLRVSIHAPRTGRDRYRLVSVVVRLAVSIHAPRTGRDRGLHAGRGRAVRFNPRAPYGARPDATKAASDYLGFNPRAPYGARLAVAGNRERLCQVSIHAPRTGRDYGSSSPALMFCVFQSTRPVRGATVVADTDDRRLGVSIHAPRTGRDFAASSCA